MTQRLDDSELAQNRHYKSRERVREQGEVFTQKREVDAMLDLMPDAFKSLDTSFLEPAAGNGNFLVEIFRRKLDLISEAEFGGTQRWFEFAVLVGLSSIYGIDIDPENVDEARWRLLNEIKLRTEDVDCLRAAEVIVETNIVVGDTLESPESIRLVKYQPMQGERFRRTIEFLRQPEVDLFYEPPEDLPEVHFSELKK